MNEEMTARLPDGRQLGYAAYGTEAPDAPVLFYFHGWPSSRYQGKLVHEGARRRGWRVIAPDRPGLGLSDPLPGRSFASWPADVAGLADALGISRFAVLGVSGGGPYALATAALLPERADATAVVCGAAPSSDPEDRRHMHWAYRTLAGLTTLRRFATPLALGAGRWMISRGRERAPMSWMMQTIPPRDREAIVAEDCWEGVTRSFLEAIRRGTPSVLADGELYLAPWDFQPEAIRVPVAFWHGQADQNLPCAVAQRLAARVPGVEGHWPEGEGHYSLPISRRDEILDWLVRKSAL